MQCEILGDARVTVHLYTPQCERMANIANSNHESQVPEIPRCWCMEPPVTEPASDERGGWESYWEGLSDNQQIFREQSDEYVRNLRAAIGLDRRARVLDFGCGFGLVAAMLAPQIQEIFVWDASANIRRRARVNLASYGNVRFLDLSESNTLPHNLQFDLILVNSVVQYMTLDKFSAWLLRWRNMLAPGGRIVVSDLIPLDYPTIWDIVDLLRFSARRGFLLRAIWQAFSEIWRYWGVRRVRPLSRIGREELSQRGRAAGLSVNCLPKNLTFFTRRVTAVFVAAGETH